jgi:hypothetical protein
LFLVLPACGGDGDGDGDATNEASGSSDEGESTAAEDGTDSAGDGDSTGDGDTTTGDGDGTTGDGDGDCGNGVVDAGEVCDDGNNVTEFPDASSLTYAATDCMADCSMLLATCNDGTMDPGEECDDGNSDDFDTCTTSCNANTMNVHAACDRDSGPDSQDITAGTITNCGSVTPPSTMEVGCVLSANFFNQTFVFGADGDCQMIAMKCEGLSCSIGGVSDLGDYDATTAADCPAGHVLVDKIIPAGGLTPMVSSKVCQKACSSDSECRWNARDEFSNGEWTNQGGTPYGQFRCQVTADSGGQRICTDARNDNL